MIDEERIRPDSELTPEELKLRREGELLVARMEYLYQTDPGFRAWLDEGFEEIERGEFIIFDETGWHEPE